MEDIDKPQAGEDSTNANSPELDSSGKVTRKAISSGSQAYSIATTLEKNNEKRNILNATIVKKYNGGQPYDPNDLKNELQDWRSNAPTGFMSGIVDRITPTPIQAIDAARHLTSASLDAVNTDSEKKSEWFRVETTKVITEWDGWRDFNAALWQEDVLIGCVAPLNLNPYSPWPKVFRGDEVFFPEGIGQHAKTVPLFAAKEDMLVSDFCDYLKDGPEISAEAGWMFEACIDAVNEALPKNTTTDSQGASQARKWQDAITEGNIGMSHSGGAKVIQLYHTVAVEPDTKKVTHFIANRSKNGETLFHKEGRFDKIEDVVTLFTLQPGSGKYYSSKGVARMLLNLHIAVERMRNGMLDNPYISNLKILKAAANSTPSLQLKTLSPFMIVTADGEFEQTGIQSNVDEFINADNQISKWAEQLVGSYISGLRGDEGPTKTAHEAVIEANRDAQAKTAFLARGLGQFANLISQIIRRLYDPETTDDAAKDLRKRALDPEDGGMTKEELAELIATPPAAVVQDLTQAQNEQIIRVYPILKGDQNVDQDKLLSRFMSASVNPQFAQDVQLTKQGLQSDEAEGMRQQILETEALLAGAPGIPVSPRDPHPTHLKVIYSDLKSGIPKIIQSAQQDPSILDHMNAQLVHSGAHIQMMQQQGAKPQDIKPFEDAQKAFESVLQRIGEQMKAQKEQNQAQESQNQAPVASIGPSSAAPDAPGGSGQPPTNQNASTDDEPIINGMRESILKAWISEYPNLDQGEKSALKNISGLAAAEPQVQPIVQQAPERIIPIHPALTQGATIMPQSAPTAQVAPTEQNTELPPA